MTDISKCVFGECKGLIGLMVWQIKWPNVDIFKLNEVSFVRVGVKTYRMVDLQEQGWAALL